MKLSDYVIKHLENYGLEDVFLLAGGGIMHIMDSLARSERIKRYYNLHEQASGFAADGYAQYKNQLAVCVVTTGPGATNVITPLASSFIDSTPILYISGQVKTADITVVEGVRQTGAQEVGIVPIVQTITKYAVTITNALEIRYHLEKAIYLATHGRPGTVWLDIPLNIQSADIEEESLKSFSPKEEGYKEYDDVKKEELDQIISLLTRAKRPCILAGTGICLSDGVKDFLRLVDKLKIPVVTSRRVKRIFNETNCKYDYGAVGVFATRSGNYILQNCDLLLVLGSGLRYYLTAYDESNFAPLAKKIVVNIHEAEIKKLRMNVDVAICCDVLSVIKGLLDNDSSRIDCSKEPWLKYCNYVREKYDIMKEIHADMNGNPNGYSVAHSIYTHSSENDIIVGSPSAFGYIQYAHQLKAGQQYIFHMGLGSMGTALPCGIGACIASGKKRTLICEGDGSLQHNIQELAVIKEYNLPIKVFIDSNGGYRQIYTMQENHFSSRYEGCNPETGVLFPNLEKLSDAYGIEYVSINFESEIEEKMASIMADETPMIIEIMSSPTQELIPVIKSRILSDGTMASSKIEDMYPFLPEEEHKYNMRLSKIQS